MKEHDNDFDFSDHSSGLSASTFHTDENADTACAYAGSDQILTVQDATLGDIVWKIEGPAIFASLALELYRLTGISELGEFAVSS